MAKIKLYKILFTPFILSSFIFLFFQLQIFNLHLYFRDEGFLTYNALRITQGQIPYRDFFLTTTPGTYYLQALLFKIFGQYLILDRILYIFIILGILFLFNKTFSIKNYFKYILLFILVIYFINPIFGFYDIEGLFLILLTLWEFKLWQTFYKNHFLILLGTTVGLLTLFKQSYGFMDFVIITLLIYLFGRRKYFLNELKYFILGILILAVPYLLYLISTNSFNQFIYYVFVFSREVKSHRIPFVFTTIIFIPIYLALITLIRNLSLKRRIILFATFSILFFIFYLLISPTRIGRFFTVFSDPLVYYYLILLIIPLTTIALYWKSKNKNIIILSFFSLGIFIASASSGRDYTTVLILSPFFIPLCFYLLDYLKIKKYKNALLFFILILFSLPFISTNFNYFLNARKYNSFIQNVPEAFGIKVSNNEANELSSIITYIKSKTTDNQTVLCFPYCPLMNVLTERKSASYFSFFYPETFETSDQSRVINDLKKNKPSMIIIQKKGSIEPEASFENQRLKILLSYFLSHYKLSKQTSNFALYIPD